MKTLLLLSLTLLTFTLRAAEPALPAFDSKSIGLPPLSLKDIVRGATRAGTHQFELAPRAPLPTMAPSVARPITRANGMPIVEPDPSVDYKLIVKAPDPSRDFKLILRDPSPEHVK